MQQKQCFRLAGVCLSLAQRYLGRRLMTSGERLNHAQWSSFAGAADAVFEDIISELPVEHPESIRWDNRRRVGQD